MKRTFLVLFALIFLMCGCKSKEVKMKTNGIKFTANVSYGNEKYELDVKIVKDGQIECKLKSPNSMNGTKFTITNETVTVDYLGLTFQKELKDLPFGNAVSLLFKALDDIKSKTATEKNGNYYIYGKVGNSKYEFAASPSGLPLSLSFPNEKISMEFKNLTLVKNGK